MLKKRGTPVRARERGVMLLEALIAILIFSVGILALVAMQGFAIATVSDAKYRADASFLANELISRMWVDRANLAAYAWPGGSAPGLLAWIAKVNAELPQSAGMNDPQVVVDAATGMVDVTIRWQPPGMAQVRSHRTIAWLSNP